MVLMVSLPPRPQIMSLVEAPFAGAWQLRQRVGMVESLRGAYAGCTVTWTRAGHAFGKKDPHAAGKTLLGFIGSDTYLGWFGSDSFFDMSALYDQIQGLDIPVQAVAAAVGLVLTLCVLGAVHARHSSGSDILGKIGLFAHACSRYLAALRHPYGQPLQCHPR